MAPPLEVPVLAEGLESEDQLRLLQSEGCHEAQGFHLSRPLPADALVDWLATDPTGSGDRDVLILGDLNA